MGAHQEYSIQSAIILGRERQDSEMEGFHRGRRWGALNWLPARRTEISVRIRILRIRACARKLCRVAAAPSPSRLRQKQTCTLTWLDMRDCLLNFGLPELDFSALSIPSSLNFNYSLLGTQAGDALHTLAGQERLGPVPRAADLDGLGLQFALAQAVPKASSAVKV